MAASTSEYLLTLRVVCENAWNLCRARDKAVRTGKCKAVCIGKKDQAWSSRFVQGLLIYAHKEDVEESVTSVHCAVSICNVNDKPAQVHHFSDALFRTLTVGLLSFRLSRNCSATKKSASDCDA